MFVNRKFRPTILQLSSGVALEYNYKNNGVNVHLSKLSIVNSREKKKNRRREHFKNHFKKLVLLYDCRFRIIFEKYDKFGSTTEIILQYLTIDKKKNQNTSFVH